MTNYECGFISKCAEYGVDGNALLKVAYGSGDEYGYIDEVPGGLFDASTKDARERLKARLEALNGLVGRPLYGESGGFPVKRVSLSKHRWHTNPSTGGVDEIDLADYARLVEDALSGSDSGKLGDAAEYWSMNVDTGRTDPELSKLVKSVSR